MTSSVLKHISTNTRVICFIFKRMYKFFNNLFFKILRTDWSLNPCLDEIVYTSYDDDSQCWQADYCNKIMFEMWLIGSCQRTELQNFAQKYNTRIHTLWKFQRWASAFQWHKLWLRIPLWFLWKQKILHWFFPPAKFPKSLNKTLKGMDILFQTTEIECSTPSLVNRWIKLWNWVVL